jgi:hypothetical protein
MREYYGRIIKALLRRDNHSSPPHELSNDFISDPTIEDFLLSCTLLSYKLVTDYQSISVPFFVSPLIIFIDILHLKIVRMPLFISNFV